MATTSSSAETVLHLHTLGVLEEFTKTSKFGLFFRSALMFHLTVKEFVHFWSKKMCPWCTTLHRTVCNRTLHVSQFFTVWRHETKHAARPVQIAAPTASQSCSSRTIAVWNRNTEAMSTVVSQRLEKMSVHLESCQMKSLDCQRQSGRRTWMTGAFCVCIADNTNKA